MDKWRQVRWVGWLVGLPGMWDDMAAWKRWLATLFAFPAAMLWNRIRQVFVDSGTMWDQALFVIACGAAVIVSYVLIISSVVQHMKRKPIAHKADASSVPGLSTQQPPRP